METTEIVESTEVPATSAPPFEPEPIEWTSIGDGLEEGRLEVPIDYADPDGDTFSLYLVRHLADDPDARIGSLLVNPGGPGFGGTILAESAEFIYSPDLLDNFDIVAWDPRGTGASEPAIDCIDNYDEYYAGTDITPDDDAERQQIIDVAESFAEQCVERNEAFIEFVGTNNSARDMDTIRRALGEDEISYFGFSYGSELGGTWATLFPETVRAAVLDGAADPNADEVDGSMQQAAGFEATLTTFLAECSANPDCAFHNDGDAEGAFDQLMSKIDEKPLPTQPGRPLLTRGVALAGSRRGDVHGPAVGATRAGVGHRLAGRRLRAARPLRLVLPASVRRHVGRFAGGVPDDPLHGCRGAPDGRGGRRLVAAVQRDRPTVLPRVRRAATSARSSPSRSTRASRSREPVPDRSSSVARPVTRPRRWRAPGPWPSHWRTDG